MSRADTAAASVLVLLLALSTVAAGRASAQAAQVTTDVGPHYVGEAVAIRVTAVGFEEEPTPSVEMAPPRNGSLELVGVSPNVSQSITIVNGQMTRTRDVTHVFQFRYTATQPGNAQLGPFRIIQGMRQADVREVRLQVQAVPSNDDLRVELSLPSGPIFVGERVPVTVSFTLEQALQKNVLEYRLNVPLFDTPDFRFLDEEGEGDTQVVIETGAGRLDLRGQSKEHREGSKRFTTVSVTRTLVPLSPGRHDIPPTSLSVEEGVRFRRDFFGGRRATKVRRWRAQAAGRSVEVAEIPGRKRPPSFGGAIGRGFTLEVAADRTVVQVGDPISLVLVVRGEGVESASLPPLDAEGLLPSEVFRVQGDVPTGEVDGDTKRFAAVVRVLAEDVDEIPALAYSWFDPDSREYQTTYSRPIALSVRSAEVIGARDVQIGDAELGVGESGADEASAARGASPRARSFALSGADLAIEQDPEVVLQASGVLGGPWVSRGLYAGSVLLLVLAVWDRRRRDVDPEQARRVRVLAEELDRVRRASTVDEVAGGLRRMLQEQPSGSSEAIDVFLGECDARSYAPAGSEVGLDAEFLGEAVRLAESIRESASHSARQSALHAVGRPGR